jgi:hypothetical protein
MKVARRLARTLLPQATLDTLRAIQSGQDGRIWDLLPRRAYRQSFVYSRTSTPFANFDGANLSDEVKCNLLDPLRAFRQRESVIFLRRGGYVTPDGGWILSGSLNLVEAGLIDVEHAVRPSFARYVRQRITSGKLIRDVPRIIHLRDWGELNYWHFLNDILGGRLRLMRKVGLGHDFQLLVGRRAMEQPFVRDIIASSDLAKAPIIVQDNELVRYREAICFETPRHSLESVDFFLQWLGATGGTTSANRRVLLARGSRLTRPMRNFSEIQAVCQRYGFETIHPGNLSLREQAKVFSEVRYLVAEHGAGLTNIAFRRDAPLSLLEIFPGWTYVHPGGFIGHPPPHYFWLACALGFEYEAVAGRTAPDGDAGAFLIDARLLEEKVVRMLAHRESPDP